MNVNILIAEDEKSVNRSMCEFINELGKPYHLVGSALNGKQAFEFFDKNMIDILLADIKMPIMDGLTLIGHVRDKYPNTKTIILSGYNDFHYVQKALQLGVADFLLKPLNKEKLISILIKTASKYYQNTIDYSSLMLNQEKWDMALIDLESDLFDQIKLGNIEGARQAVENLLSAFKDRVNNDYFRMIPFITDSMLALNKRMTSYRNMDRYLPSIVEFKNTLSTRSQNNEEIEQIMIEFVLTSVKLISDFRKQTSPDIIYHCTKILNEQFNKDISLQEMANITGVTPPYLSRLFKKELGVNYIHYINQLRIEKAKELLNSPHFKIMDIANIVGYGNVNYFSRTFKKITGLSPQDYREKMGVSE